jgi:UPF0755 protein
MKNVFLVLALCLLALGVFAWHSWERYTLFLETPLAIPQGGQVFDLGAGASGTGIVQSLADLGLTRTGWEWRVLMRLKPHVYRTGEYLLPQGAGPQDVLRHLSGGQVIQYQFTLVEGWTFNQLLQALATNPVLQQSLDSELDFQRTETGTMLEIDHPEGWFLPETYQFTRGDSDRDILLRAHSAMQTALSDAWSVRNDDLPLETPFQLLTLASIIEKETSLDEERSRVAGVFVRRLRKHMRLQTDPTVIYGMGESFDGDIRRRDLKTDTPYNTYTRHGLPPTPIAMPGKASLMAAARPAEGDEFYFVANGKGGHTFSVTLEEHQAAVNKLTGKN